MPLAPAQNECVATLDAEHAQPIGRATELAFVPRFLDALTDGPAELVFEGDAGIGKTTLWVEGVSDARARGYRVLACRPAETELPLPFSALGDLLDQVADDTFAPLPEPQRRALDVAMLRADPAGEPIERRAVALALLAVLRRLAGDEPVVVALDDIQWIDEPSTAALQFALRRIERERIGVLGTRRPGGRPSLLLESAEVVHVRPLDVDACGRMLAERLGLSLARPAIVQLYRVSEGNPFLALEVGRALQRREIVPKPGQPFPVPQNLRELVRDRVGAIPQAAREAALVVAALAVPTLDRLMAAGVDEAALSAAVVAKLVEIDDERVRFTHPLLGSIVYSEAAPARRRELHTRLAASVEDIEERATHLALAAAGPDAATAAALDDAAGRAFRRGAPETAADLYAQAAALTPEKEARLRHRRLVDAGEVRLRAGDVPAARRAFETALAAAPDAAARARALSRLGAVGAMLVLEWQADALSAALETCRRAAAEAGDDPALVSAIELDLTWVEWIRGNRGAAVAHARKAVELAERIGENETLARALVSSALLEGRGPNASEARQLLDRAFALEHHVRHGQFGERPQFVQALFLAGDGQLDAARELTLDEHRLAVEGGDEGSLPTLLEHLTVIERRAGNWAEAEGYAHEMYEKAQRSHFAPEYHSAPYAWILALRGHLDEAARVAETGMRLADAGGIGPTFAGHRAVLGLIALSRGDARACVDVLASLSTQLTSDIAEHGWFRFLADEVEARLALGEVDAAATLVDKLSDRRAVLLDTAWARAATARCQGLVLAEAGDEAGADRAFALALEEHERLGDPFELGRTLVARGRVERRFKRRRAARERLEAARELFAGVGAPAWVERTAEELGRIGGRAPRQSGLTPTETRVAELAAQGLTNREIAAALFLSANTVHAYLKRVYREVGVRSRAELAHHFRARDDQ